jgi:hypothetical protein
MPHGPHRSRVARAAKSVAAAVAAAAALFTSAGCTRPASDPPPSGPAPAPLSPPPIAGNLLRPAAEPESWVLEQQYGTGRATMSRDGDAIRVAVTRADGKYWHVQFYQVVKTLEEGKTYTLSFRAKANTVCDLPLVAAKNQDDYHPVGLIEHALLTRDWKPFTYNFTVRGSVPGNSRVPVFMVGQKPATVWVSDVVLRERL